jgi:hypothetical protein
MTCQPYLSMMLNTSNITCSIAECNNQRCHQSLKLPRQHLIVLLIPRDLDMERLSS